MPPPRFLTPEKLEEVASSFLSQYHPSGDVPVPIEEIVEFDFGLNIIPFPNLKNDFDIDGFLACGAETIYVDDGQHRHRSEVRLRFTLAHEISHHELHKEIFDEADIHSLDDYLRFQDELDPVLRDNYEFQAYNVAGRILVPTGKLVEASRDALDTVRGRLPTGIDRRALCSVLAARVAEPFNVSTSVVEKRLLNDSVCNFVLDGD